jgi:predicted dehydrogenase
MTVRVGLIGANGHGRWHRRRIAELAGAGAVRLMGIADPAGVEPAPEVEVFGDHRALLAAVPLDVAVICTPPHTHLAIARDALAAGCDVLLEKPPVRTLDEHDQLRAAAEAAGRAVQVGFQALGSAALRRLTGAIAEGRLGTVTSIATVASWQRDDAYYARAPWAGRAGVDGALVNPLAHAVMQCLAIAGDVPARMAAERYRVRPIETDDTAFARIEFHGGLRMMAAVTLAGAEFIAGEVIVTGTAGRAVLEYPTDRLRLPGEAEPRRIPGRVDLLSNLLDHRRDPAAAPLLAPLDGTAGFTAVVEALTAPGRPPPVRLEPPLVAARDDPPVRTVTGIEAVLRQAAETLLLPSELGVAWAGRPFLETFRRPFHCNIPAH